MYPFVEYPRETIEDRTLDVPMVLTVEAHHVDVSLILRSILNGELIEHLKPEEVDALRSALTPGLTALADAIVEVQLRRDGKSPWVAEAVVDWGNGALALLSQSEAVYFAV
jgi:hypothetical protein